MNMHCQRGRHLGAVNLVRGGTRYLVGWIRRSVLLRRRISTQSLPSGGRSSRVVDKDADCEVTADWVETTVCPEHCCHLMGVTEWFYVSDALRRSD
jgi:hypothetical protein